MAESLLSQPIPYACLWLPRNGGFTLWSHKFWIFAIASYLAYFLLLPCYNLSILTKWSSKNLSLSCSKFTFQKKKKNSLSSSFREKSRTFPWLKISYVLESIFYMKTSSLDNCLCFWGPSPSWPFHFGHCSPFNFPLQCLSFERNTVFLGLLDTS